MLIPMRLVDVPRTEGASTSRAHRFILQACFPLCVYRSHLRNSIAPNFNTSYFPFAVLPHDEVIAIL